MNQNIQLVVGSRMRSILTASFFYPKPSENIEKLAEYELHHISLGCWFESSRAHGLLVTGKKNDPLKIEHVTRNDFATEMLIGEK